MKKQWGFILAALMTIVVMAMSGCGGGGGSGGGDANPGGGGTVTYSISGTTTSGGAALAGVSVSTSGGSATSDASGNYTISGLANGGFTVTSAKLGYTFTPASLTVTVNGANVTGNNFTATPAAAGTYSISGTITSSSAALVGVTVTLSGSGSTTATTDNSGNFSFSGIQNGSYTLTPTKTGYTFTPASQTVTVNGANLTGKNFTAAGTTSGTTITALSVLQSGLSWPMIRSYNSGTTNITVYGIYTHGLAANGANDTQTNTINYFDRVSKTWTTTRPAGVPTTIFDSIAYDLTASGWVSGAFQNMPTTSAITFNSDGNVNGIAYTATDISGQTIGAQPFLSAFPILTTAGTFPAGSKLYYGTITATTDEYSISDDRTFNLTTLAQVPTSIQEVYVESFPYSSDIRYSAKFVSGGMTVDFYQKINSSAQPVKIGSGSYAAVTVLGQQMLEISVPGNLRALYNLGGNPIFGIVNGKVYQGTHYFPGLTYNGGEANIAGFNNIATQHLKNSFNTAVSKDVVAKNISKYVLGL